MISGVLCMLFVEIVFAENEEKLIKVTPEIIVDTFKSMMSSKYLRELADDFATKAAEHLLEQIKKNNDRISNPSRSDEEEASVQDLATPSRETLDSSPEDPVEDLAIPSTDTQDSLPLGSRVADPAVSQSQSYFDGNKLSPQILTLLQDPSPDGDNLDTLADLSDNEGGKTKETGKKISKINGKYFRNRKYHLIFLE